MEKYFNETLSIAYKEDQETGEKTILKDDFAYEIAYLIKDHFRDKKSYTEVLELIEKEAKHIEFID